MNFWDESLWSVSFVMHYGFAWLQIRVSILAPVSKCPHGESVLWNNLLNCPVLRNMLFFHLLGNNHVLIKTQLFINKHYILLCSLCLEAGAKCKQGKVMRIALAKLAHRCGQAVLLLPSLLFGNELMPKTNISRSTYTGILIPIHLCAEKIFLGISFQLQCLQVMSQSHLFRSSSKRCACLTEFGVRN